MTFFVHPNLPLLYEELAQAELVCQSHREHVALCLRASADCLSLRLSGLLKGEAANAEIAWMAAGCRVKALADRFFAEIKEELGPSLIALQFLTRATREHPGSDLVYTKQELRKIAYR